MIPCPSCQKSIEIEDKHLGTLFTCPYCNSVYFIDWNGQPELALHDSEPEFQPLPATDNYSPNFEVTEQSEEFEQPEQSFNENYEAEAKINEAYETPITESPYDFNSTLDQVPDSISNSLDTPDFSDVTDYANSNETVGPLTYTVIIEGIDSSHLVLQLKEAITDSRFGWNIEDILNQIGQGRLVLTGLSPAKGSVLINRIKYLPFKISWRQDVLSHT